MKVRLIICFFILLSFRGYGQSCIADVSLSQSAPAICSGYSVAIGATPAGGTAPYTYLWSTGETTQVISVNKGGTYSVTVSDNTPGCQPIKKSITITDAVTPGAPTANDASVCPGNTATLTATAPGGFYQWYDAATGGNFLASGANFTTPVINSPVTYYVQTTLNNCTSIRTPVSVNINSKPMVAGAAICPGNVATLTATGGSAYTWYDAPNGNVLSTAANFVTPVLYATTTYYVVVIINGCASAPTPVTAAISNSPQTPAVTNTAVCLGSSASLHATAASGIFNWYSVPTGGTSLISSPDYTTPPLTATTTYYVENMINDCVSARAPVTVTVNPPPPAPAAQTNNICYNTSTILTAGNDASLIYQWYDAPVNGNLIQTGNSFTTPVLTNSTSYYVLTSNGSCISTRTQINVNVNAAPAAPSVAGSIVCQGSITTLTANAPGGTYSWYDAAAGGNLLATGNSFTTPPITVNTTYYVETNLAGCTSSRAPVLVSVLPVTPPPTAAGASVCPGTTAALSASGGGTDYTWYDSATGGTLLSSSQIFVTPALTATTTYYVATTANGCVSTRTPVTVTINTPPSPPTANGVTTCTGTAATLTAGGGGTLQWYDSPTGGNLLVTGPSFTTPVLKSNTTYYVQSTNGQCVSARTAVTVTVTPMTDPQFLYSSGTFCATAPNQTPVIYNTSGGTFSTSSPGLVLVSATTGEINVTASTPGNYLISFIGNDACPHTSTAKIAITLTANSSFDYTGPFCQDGVNPLPIFSGGGSGGTFTATPAGLVFVSSSTGEIDLTNSTPGTYTVVNNIAANGSCPASSGSVQVVINKATIVNAGPLQTVGIGSTVQLAGSISGAATTGTWSGGTGTFSDPTILNPVYTPGTGETTATLTLTSAAPPGSCGPKAATVNIIITAASGAPTAQGIATCMGSNVTLSATAPGGTYQWYDAATGGSLLQTGATYVTPTLTATTTYYVQTTNNGNISNRTPVTVTINAIPTAPVAPAVQVCSGSVANLSATGPAGTYQWYDAAAGGNLLSASSNYVTPALTANTSYFVQATVNNCVSPRTQVDVTVTPIPHVTSASAGTTCSGTALNYTITADLANTTMSWSRTAVAGISNAAVSNQASAIINETLINTSSNAVNVTYTITPTAGSCSGPAFIYVVTVYPTPVITGASAATICNGTTDDYAITFNTPNTDFTWSRDAVAGISNLPVSGQTAPVIKEVLYNTTAVPVNVTYVVSYKTSTCAAAPFSFVITVNPDVKITSPATGMACSGYPQNYAITSNIPGATFVWSRAGAVNIKNIGISNQTSPTITETLINVGSSPVDVVYVITPMANGCAGTPFNYTVSVGPTVPTPVANANSPVCVGSDIHLRTPSVDGASYLWTGPNNYTSSLQNPDITNVADANAGNYGLVITINGCTSIASTVPVVIDDPSFANAGPNQNICISTTVVNLAGSITGGSSTGIWTTSGTGTFIPAGNVLNARYVLSDADKAAGSVVLTLSSTSKSDCSIATASMTVTFGVLPAVSAGENQEICSQNGSVKLNGKQFIAGPVLWTTSGTGTFSPSASLLDASYIPSAADLKAGAVTLTLTAVNAGMCYSATSDVSIKLSPPPTLNAGGTRYVLRDRTITLMPAVSDNKVTYHWSPNTGISNVTIKNPVVTGIDDITYTLTVTDSLGCVSTDTTRVIVSPAIHVDNTFTPNADGINDLWVITGLIAYQDATVDIFTRYGQRVYHSIGYDKPWDGTYGSKALPVGVYYFVIDTKYKGIVVSGYVTIIR